MEQAPTSKQTGASSLLVCKMDLGREIICLQIYLAPPGGCVTMGCWHKYVPTSEDRMRRPEGTTTSRHGIRTVIQGANKYKLRNVFCTYILHGCSVTKSCLTLGPHGLQHARLPCPSWYLGVYSNSCALSWWCAPIISSSAMLFSFCLQSFPAPGSFPMSRLFTSCGQSTGASISSSVLPVNIQGLFPLGLIDLIFLPSKGLSRVFSSTRFDSINSLALSLLYGPTCIFIHDKWTNHSFDNMDLCWQRDVSAF